MTDWQLIKTAPKDGTLVILWWPSPGNPKCAQVCMGYWLDNSHSAVPAARHALWTALPKGAVPWDQPTHWMPRPEPPEGWQPLRRPIADPDVDYSDPAFDE